MDKPVDSQEHPAEHVQDEHREHERQLELEREYEHELESSQEQWLDYNQDEQDQAIALEFGHITAADIVFPTKDIRLKKIGKYIQGEMIGEGSYSKVKEAIDETTLQRCAMKIMTKQRLKKIPKGEENAKRELAVLRKLNHRNCVKLIDYIYDHTKEKMYLMLDFCFTNLQQLCECGIGGRFPYWQAHKYFKQVLAGIDYLHANRIVHNDIKPGNLLINAKQVIKICDFGVSIILDTYSDSDLIPTVEGTPAFVPPEIAKGDNKVHGFKVDMWAAGISLFKFTTGFYPYEGENIYLLYDEILASDPNIDEDRVSCPLLRDLLKKLLTRKVARRLSSQQALVHEWIQTPNHEKYDEILQDEVKIDVKISKVTSLLSKLYLVHTPPEEESPTHDSDELRRLREEQRKKNESDLPIETKLYREFWRYTKKEDDDPRIKSRYRFPDSQLISIEPTSTFLAVPSFKQKARGSSDDDPKKPCAQS